MIDVLVLGQPYWASRIARALDTHTPDMKAVFVPRADYLQVLARRPRSERVVIMRAGYRVGSTTTRGRAFDLYWTMLRKASPGAIACHYWLGTEVMNMLDEAKAGTLRTAAVAATRHDLHVADAQWLAEELESVGLQAATAHVPMSYRGPNEPAPFPAGFAVLTYLPDRRFAFYGGDVILEAASRMPDVRFDVVGAVGPGVRAAPTNVRWHSWVSDMTRLYSQSTVVVRIPQHDGMGATVIEGLLHARHVIYTHDVPFVQALSVVTADALVAHLSELLSQHRDGRLGLNIDGRAYALREFDEHRVALHLAALVRAQIESQ
jgi:hypothetical protein